MEMIKRTSVIPCFAAISAMLAMPTPLAAGVHEEPRRLIIQFDQTSPLANRDKFTQRVQQGAGMQLGFIRDLALEGFQLFALPSQVPDSALQNLMKALSNMPGVISVEEDVILYPAATPTDSRYSEQWHYYEPVGGLNAQAAWDTHTGNGAVVAVIDTGYTEHSDLSANVINGYDFIDSTSIANDGDGRDADARDPGDAVNAWECGFFAPLLPQNSSWHGTHVAGTIAAAANGSGVVGVAYDAKVLAVRALGKCGGRLSDITDAVIWSAGGSVNGVPANPNPAQVINMSLGGTGACGSAYQAAIDSAVANGATVVVAAGNDNQDAKAYQPASCNNVVTVAANDREGNRASYSNFGALVDVTAPGGETSGNTANGVLSTLNAGSQAPAGESYAFYQGTSMAAPHVAGVAALLYSAKPDISPSDVEAILKASARTLPGECSGGCGEGIVDARAALDMLADGGVNLKPIAAFTYVANDLTVNFTDASRDPDGSIVSYEWDFGDGVRSTLVNPEYTYGQAGSYTVTLTVTDDRAASTTRRETITVKDLSASDIQLAVSRTNYWFWSAFTLSWRGAVSQQVDIYRNNEKVATVANSGSWSETQGLTSGSPNYRICEQNTTICSADVSN